MPETQITSPSTPLLVDHEMLGLHFLVVVLKRAIVDNKNLNDIVYIQRLEKCLGIHSPLDQDYWKERCENDFKELAASGELSPLWCLNYYNSYITQYRDLSQTQRHLFNLIKSTKISRSDPDYRGFSSREFKKKQTLIEKVICKEIQKLPLTTADIQATDVFSQTSIDVARELGLRSIATVLKNMTEMDAKNNTSMERFSIMIDHEMAGLHFLILVFKNLNLTDEEDRQFFLDFLNKLGLSVFNEAYWYKRCHIEFPEIIKNRALSAQDFWFLEYYMAYVDHYCDLTQSERYLFGLLKSAKLNRYDVDYQQLTKEEFDLKQLSFELSILEVFKARPLSFNHLSLTDHFGISLEDTAISLGLINIRDDIYSRRNAYDPVLLKLKQEEIMNASSALDAACIAGDEEKVEQFLKEDKIIFLPSGDMLYYPIHQAILRRQTAIAISLIHNKPECVLHVDKYGQTPLMYAAKDGNHRLVKLLLKYKNDLNATIFGHENISLNGKTALHLAIENNHLYVVKLLLSSNARLENTDSAAANLLSIIRLAITCKSNTVLGYLLKHSLSQNCRPSLELVDYAMQCNNFNAARLILLFLNTRKITSDTNLEIAAIESGIKLKHSSVEKLILLANKVEISHLCYAIENNNEKLLQVFLERIKDTHFFDRAEGRVSALSLACQHKRQNMVNRLLKTEMTLTSADEFDSPLHFCIHRNYEDAIEYLYDKQTVCDRDGFTPFLYAVKKGRLATVKCMVTKGADIKERCGESTKNYLVGKSALAVAFHFGQVSVARYLIGLKADMTESVFIAANKKNADLIELLLENNLSFLKKKNENGKSILQIAATTGHVNVVVKILDFNSKLLITKDEILTLVNELRSADTKNVSVVITILELFLKNEFADGKMKFSEIVGREGLLVPFAAANNAEPEQSVAAKRKQKKRSPKDSPLKVNDDIIIDEQKIEAVKEKCFNYMRLYNELGCDNYDEHQKALIELQNYLKRNKEVYNAPVFDSMTPLMLAVKMMCTDVIEFLLLNRNLDINAAVKPDINNPSEGAIELQGWTALHFAIDNCGDADLYPDAVDTFTQLLNHSGTDLKAVTGREKFTPLHIALRKNLLVIFIELYEKVPEQILEADIDGKTAFATLATCHVEEHDIPNKKNCINLVFDVLEGSGRLIPLLNKKYTAHNIEGGSLTGCTLIHEVVAKKQHYVLETLISMDANCKLPADNGLTPLMLAIRANDNELAGILLKIGNYQESDYLASLQEHIRTTAYEPNLQLFLQAKHYQVVALLVEKQPKLMHQIDKKTGWTMIRFAWEHDPSFDLFVKRYIAIYKAAHSTIISEAKSSNERALAQFKVSDIAILRKASFFYAIKTGQIEWCKLLLNEDITLFDATNRDGKKPLPYALSLGDKDFAKALMTEYITIKASLMNSGSLPGNS